MADFSTGIVIRGKYLEGDQVEFGGRGGDATFLIPDPKQYVDQFPMGSSTKLTDLYDLSFDDLLDYLVELGTRLDVEKNAYLAEAREASYRTSRCVVCGRSTGGICDRPGPSCLETERLGRSWPRHGIYFYHSRRVCDR